MMAVALLSSMRADERVLAEGREERLDDGAGLQDAQEADVELGHLVEEQAHPVERADEDVAAQEVRPAVGQLLQVAVGELADLALVALVDQGQPIARPASTWRSTQM